MKIGIIGASGNAGRDLFREATKRGHQTTAIVRSAAKAADVLGADAAVLERDAFAIDAEDLAAFDVVINAFGSPS
ncbi:MAG: NAD(P)H-binding protein [Actinomycetota bacterium]